VPIWQSGFFQVNGVRLHYTRTGGNYPPLVLAHGLYDDGSCWMPVARALEASYDIVMVDARGHGRSDAPEQAYDPSVMAEDLAGLITGLHLRLPIILGHSLGAATALILAGRHPDLPRAVALEDPTPWWGGDETLFNPAWLAEAIAWIEGLKRQSRQAIVAAQHVKRPHWSLDELESWANSKLLFNSRFLNHVSPPELNWPELLRRIISPVLLITGDPALGSAVTDRHAMALHATVPRVSRTHISGAGHNIRRDQLEAYLAAIGVQFATWTDNG
jgi:N-formylmaleamate deformylase